MSYRDTLHLPETAFPMKANLPQKEPGWIAFWKDKDVYGRLEIPVRFELAAAAAAVELT